MKQILWKNMTFAALILATVYTGTVFAHTQSGALGTSAGATDLYVVNCSTDAGGSAYRLGMQVRTGAAGAGVRVSVRTQKGYKATNSTDSVNGDTISSPMTYNASGNGVYYVSVGKSTATTVNVPYLLNFHCQSSTGAHTGTDWFMVQNQ